MKISDIDFAAWDVTDGATGRLPADYDADAPWAATVAPAFADAAARPETAAVLLKDLIGKSFDDALWETLLDEITLAEALDLINLGGYNTAAIPYIGKPSTLDTDGPQGWTGSGVGGSALTTFATEPVVASTWNKELAYEMGKMIGEQGMWGNSDVAAGTSIKGYQGWYSPAMNTHRTPIGARYNEYYSEDGVLAGAFAANTSLGAKSKGAYVYIKHFALHEDGGTLRGNMMDSSAAGRTAGLSVWCDEQTMREIYFKPFQIAVEQGGAQAAMSSFSRIGSVWAGGSYALLTEVLRNEWGFRGFVVTDIEIYAHCNAQQMVRAGGDLVLSAMQTGPSRLANNAESNTPTQLAAVRKAVKNILYVVANSSAMQAPLGAAVRYVPKTLSAGTVGAAYSATLAATAGTGTGAAAQGFYWNTLYTGYADRNYAVTSGALPAGLALDSSSGAITGTPTAAGSFVFTVTCSAEGYASASAAFTVNVAASVLAAPVGLAIDSGKLSWTAVDNASGYVVEVNGIQYALNASATEYSLFGLAKGGYTLKVKAVGSGAVYGDSDWSETAHTVAESDLPAGPQGSQGEQGAQGPAGEKGDAGVVGSGCKSSANLLAALGLLAAAFVAVVAKNKR
jgi:beta-glucosidase